VRLARKRKLDNYLGYILIALLLPVTRLLGVTLRRSHKLNNTPSYLLFIKLLGLGSLVSASDAILAMRKKYPDAKFILLTERNIAEGIAPFQLFDEIWTTPDEDFWGTCRQSVGLLFKTWKLKKLWVIDLEVYSKLTTVYALLTLAQNRFGFFLGPVFFRKYLNTHNVFFNREDYLEDNYLAMAKAVTGSEEYAGFVRTQRANESSKPYIILNNTCSDLALVRKLPEKTFSDVCQWILENTTYSVAIAGAPKDKEEINRFIELYPELNKQKERISNIAGSMNFAAYYRFLEEKGVCLVTIDSGPLHIARKLGLPTVSVWGPTDPANYLKVEEGQECRHQYEYLHVHCSPCVHHYSKLPCGGYNFCMKNISSQHIIEKLQIVLEHLN
jgi:ADP-heptose:LPS heptosyltransferase